MLLELRIQDYAVIDRISVRLGPGLNVLTGETGAGKSIIVGALSLLLGERASSDVVRPGAEHAVVEGVFDVAGRDDLVRLLDEQGISTEDGLLILRRVVAAEGRNRAWVNGAASTAALVGELGRRLVDLHGQHEHQTLLRADEQRAILDAFAEAGDVAVRVAGAWDGLREAEAELASLEERRERTAARAEDLRFTLRELEDATLEEGEDERIAEELRRLEHAEELALLAGELHESLYAGDAAATSRLARLRRDADRLIGIDPSQAELRELLETAYYAAEEAGRRMGDYAAGIEHSPARLEKLRLRQDLLYRLLRKHGPTIGDALAAADEARAQLALLDDGDVARRDLEARVEERRKALDAAAAELTSRRTGAAERLAAEVADTLPELGMPGARFEVRLETLDPVGRTGAESVAFVVSVNPGFPPRPLARVASGGELARVMLALKTALAAVDEVPSLVFDEIDAGIGGTTANRVGEKLEQVAREHQVFAITHLPQIAARADQHFRVEKAEGDDVAATRVDALESDERAEELARMLGGEPPSAASLRHARELLRGSRESGNQGIRESGNRRVKG